MWSFITSVLLRWAALKVLLRALGSLGWLLPVGLILKAIGVPGLVLLAILAVPLLVVLALVGLPLLAVLALGGFLLTVTFWLISLGVAVLKVAIPIFVIWWLLTLFFRPRREGSVEG